MFQTDFDIRLELAGIDEWIPDAVTAEGRRRALIGVQSDGNWLFLGFTGPDPTSPEPGVVVPFDNRVLVFDDPARAEPENTRNLAHLLGHMFGAWHSRDSKSVMHLPPGSDFDTTALSCIRATRTFDTRNGAKGLSPESETRLTALWAETKSTPVSNPLFQHFAANGEELMSMGLLPQAVDPLSRAIHLAPSDAQPHYALATTYMLLRRYQAAAVEFRKLTELDPNSAPALNDLANILVESHRPEGAMASLRKAADVAPRNASLHANIGMALALTSGHLNEGIEELRLALRLNPNDPVIKVALDGALAAKATGRN